MRIDPFIDQLSDVQFVDVKDRGVTIVKDQRVAQHVSARVVSVVIDKAVEDALVQRKSAVKILEYFFPFKFHCSFIQDRSFRYHRTRVR